VGDMITVGRMKVLRIPEYFMIRYDSEIVAWARNWAKLPMHDDDPNQRVKSFVLREGWLADDSPNEEQGKELLQVKLIGRLSRRGVEIEPYRRVDERLIARHCTKLMRQNVHPLAHLRELPRPFMPFMPTIVKPDGKG
jgi:hypothetical protein